MNLKDLLLAELRRLAAERGAELIGEGLEALERAIRGEDVSVQAMEWLRRVQDGQA